MATALEDYTNEEQRSVVLFFCGQNDSMQRIFIHKEIFSFYGEKCFSRKAVHVLVEKFCQGRSKVADDARPGRPVEIVQRMEELIRADRRIMIDTAATALGRSHGLACSVIHQHLKFRKMCARWEPRELKIEKKWTEWICPCNISYGMLMNEKVCLTGVLLRTNHGCITTNPNQSVLQFNGNIPVHLKRKV
jgi:hypothetical protein